MSKQNHSSSSIVLSFCSTRGSATGAVLDMSLTPHLRQTLHRLHTYITLTLVRPAVRAVRSAVRLVTDDHKVQPAAYRGLIGTNYLFQGMAPRGRLFSRGHWLEPGVLHTCFANGCWVSGLQNVQQSTLEHTARKLLSPCGILQCEAICECNEWLSCSRFCLHKVLR